MRVEAKKHGQIFNYFINQGVQIMTKDMTMGSPLRMILLFSVPVLLGNIFQQFYNMVDTIIVGQYLGEDALAAVGSTGCLMFLVLGFANGIAQGFGVMVSHAFGAKDFKLLKHYVALSLILTAIVSLLLTIPTVAASRQFLILMKTPDNILGLADSYIKVIFAGILLTMSYNVAAGILRGIGDSKTPLYFLVFSSVLNIILDIVFIVPMHMGVAGAAWATILSQFLSAVFSTVVGLRNFPILHLRREDFHDLKGAAVLHLKTGFPMGFQMSVMCIGQLAMQAVVNSLGTAAVAGYTAASKADQLSVLVNNAMMTAISNYVAQNFGAGKKDRIRLGVRASLIQTEAFNILMCIGILLLRHPIVELFLSNPTAEIYHYSDAFLTIEAPFYFLLGLLAVYRTSIQSMQNGRAPFAACMIELVMRLAATVWLSRFLGYTAVCIASPLAWFGAIALLIPVYYRMMMKPVKTV